MQNAFHVVTTWHRSYMNTMHTTACSGDRKPAPLLNAKPIALRLTEQERVEAFELANKQNRSAANLALLAYRAGLQVLKSQGAL